MLSTDDIALLRSFVDENSEAAFATLVSRHIGLVYSAALRQTGDPQTAEEVTQAVFIVLARKAASLRKDVILPGWLYQTARLTAANHRRAENRRRRREQEAYMNALDNENQSSVDSGWDQIAPLLESAMGSLNEADRNTIVLRYFENRDMPSIAAALNASEVTTRKRLSRAVERLRKFFSKRGIAISSTALGTVVSAHSVHAAPPALAVGISAAVAKNSAVTASTSTLVKLTMKSMQWLKLKFALGLGSVILLGGGLATVAVTRTNDTDSATVQDIAKGSLAVYQSLSSYSDTGTILADVNATQIQTTFTTKLQRPGQYRIAWNQTSGSYSSGGIVWSDGKGNNMVMGVDQALATALPQQFTSMENALASATGISSGAAANIPGTFFNLNWGGQLKNFMNPKSNARRQPDESVGDFDCYVVSYGTTLAKLANTKGGVGPTTNTIWIGKRDHLIHKIQTSIEIKSMAIPAKLTDAQIKNALEKSGKPATQADINALRKTIETSIKSAQGTTVFTETHENFILNASYPASDFVRSP